MDLIESVLIMNRAPAYVDEVVEFMFNSPEYRKYLKENVLHPGALDEDAAWEAYMEVMFDAAFG